MKKKKKRIGAQKKRKMLSGISGGKGLTSNCRNRISMTMMTEEAGEIAVRASDEDMV